jgi:hypothetical protein
VDEESPSWGIAKELKRNLRTTRKSLANSFIQATGIANGVTIVVAAMKERKEERENQL